MALDCFMTEPRERTSTIGLRRSGSRWTATFSAVTSRRTMISALAAEGRDRAARAARSPRALIRGAFDDLMAVPTLRAYYQAGGRALQSPRGMTPGGIILTPRGEGRARRLGRALP